MKGYLISIVIAAVATSLSELVMPQGRLKNTVRVVLAICLTAVMVAPLSSFDFSTALSADTDIATDANFENFIDESMKNYYEKQFKKRLLECDLVTDKIYVEIEGLKKKKAEVYLSNTVMEENGAHINISVIKDYVAEALSLDGDILSVYV